MQNAPSLVLDCRLVQSRYDIVEKSAVAITFEFIYKRPAQNTVRREMSVTTKAKKIYSFIAPVGVYDSTGDVTSTNTSLQWKPDRQGAADEFNASKAVTIEPLPETRRLNYETTANFVTARYLTRVANLVSLGCFNQSSFDGFKPFTIQILASQAIERDDDDWDLSFGFGVFEIDRTSTSATTWLFPGCAAAIRTGSVSGNS